MKLGIYKLTSPSGKSYIGQSVNLDKRIRQYKSLNCKSQPAIYNAILKYGIDNFKIDILWSTEDDTNIYFILNQLEEDFINLYDSINYGYNIKEGGRNGKHSEETKLKISESKIGNNNMLGKKHSEETKIKIGNIHRGKIVSEKTRQKMSETKQSMLEQIKINSKKQKNRRKTSILQYNLQGDFIKKWEMISYACKELNICNSSISNCLKGLSKSAGHFIWQYE